MLTPPSMFLTPAGSIEACLSHLLKRRAAGFLRSDKIAALFTKIGKVNATASEVCRKVQEQLQQQSEITRSHFLSIPIKIKMDFTYSACYVDKSLMIFLI